MPDRVLAHADGFSAPRDEKAFFDVSSRLHGFHKHFDSMSDAEAHDLFPDIFDFENYSAIGPERLRELQTALQNTRGADMLSTPTLMTVLGQKASISIGNSNDTMLSLGLKADPVADDGGYDLSLDLQRQE